MTSKLDIPIATTDQRVPAAVWIPPAVLAVLLTGYFVYANNYRKLLRPKNWGTVVEGQVYRSGQIEPHLVADALADHRIRVVVNLQGADPNSPHQLALKAAAEQCGATIHWFRMRGNGTPGHADPNSSIREYARAIAALERARRAGKPVLVQCGAGTHRTGGVVAAWRMLVRREDGHEAYRELKAYKWNPYRHQVLPEWVNDNLPAIGRQLVEMGVIEAVPDPLPRLGPVIPGPALRDRQSTRGE